jgi:hypothetical protein
MVVAVCYIDLDVLELGVEYRGKATRFIEAGVEGAFVLETGFPIAKPSEDLVAERINDFDLVVVSISHKHNVLIRNEVDSQGVLEPCCSALSICVPIGMQVLGIRIPTNDVPSRLQRLHVNRSDS